MTRARKLSILIPSLIGGVVLFASTFGRADDGRTVAAFWPAASDVTVPRHAQPPVPPAPPSDPWGGGTSHSHRKHRHGISVSIHDGKVQIEGVHDMVAGQIESVREMLRNNPSIPKDIRDRVLARLDRVNGILDRRLAKLNATDIDQLGDELGKMGDEIEKAMDGISDDLSKLGDQWGKDFADKFSKDWQKSFKKFDFSPKKFNFKVKGNDDDNDDNNGNSDDGDDDSASIPPTPPTPPVPSNIDSDDPDTRSAIADLGNLSLRPDQRDQLRQLRADTDRQVSDAKREIDRLADDLHNALERPSVSDDEINRYVDQISQQETRIRKARILAWVKARRALDDDQRQRVMQAAAKAKHH